MFHSQSHGYRSELKKTAEDQALVIELHVTKDDNRPVFLTGNFNNWKTADPAFQMTKLGNGNYSYTFFDFSLQSIAVLEYKYVKGGWEAEELDKHGHPTMNRVIRTPRGKVFDTVSNWKVHESWYDPTYFPIIEIAAKQFTVPQLRRRRRISVLLPYNYYKQPEKNYPVLYLQDGQNLFENQSPYGTWGVDRQLAKLAKEGHGEVIIVAIDHGGKERISEYSPVDTQQFGEGLGKDYARFLAETLKPYIDEKYRTLSDRDNTGIGGSSMGGLISLYAGLLFPNTFSKFMIFSPSLWLTPGMFEAFRAIPIEKRSKFFFFSGGKETAATVRNTQVLHEIISKTNRHVTSEISIDPEANHSEYFWGRAFPTGIKQLFA
jgi:predicted alpha/beta superfamily hydrolase